MKSRLGLIVLTSLILIGTCLNHGDVALADPPQQEANLGSDPNRKVDDIGDPLPAGAIARMGSIRFRPGTNISGLGLSADGSVLISIGNHVTAWNSKTGQELWRDTASQPHRNSGYCHRDIAFANACKRFYTIPSADQIFVWDVQKGSESTLDIVGRQRGGDASRQQGQYSIDVTADASSFAIGGPHELVVCDGNGNVRFTVQNAQNNPRGDDQNDRLAFGGPYTYGRFSPNGESLALVTSDRPREIRLHDTVSGVESGKIGLTSKAVQLCFAPDGQKIATTERDSAVRLYDAASGQQAWSNVFELKNPFENYTSAIEFNPQGNLLAVAATDHRIHLIDASDGTETGLLIGHDWYPWCLAFSSDGTTLHSSGWEGIIRQWDVANRKQRPLPAGRRGSEAVCASPDGNLIAFVDDEDLIHLLDAASREERQTLTYATPGWSQVVFSPDSRYLAAGGSRDDRVHVAIWDLAKGQVHREWDWPKGKDPHSTVEAIEFSPDGRWLAAAVFRQSRVVVYDLTSEQENAQLRHGQVYGLSFSPDSKTLATVGWDKMIRFWEMNTAKGASVDDSSTVQEQVSPLVEKGGSLVNLSREVKVPDDKGDERMYAVCYSQDSIATAHLDGKVRIWHPETLVVKNKFAVPGRFIYGAIRFSPDGQWLATGTMGGEVILWEPWTGKTAHTAGRHESYVYTVGFGRNNRTMVSGGNDSVSYLWDLAPFSPDRNPDIKESGGKASDPYYARLWQQLSSANSNVAYRAMWKLADAPEQAVALISEKLRPVRTVYDLDHDDDSKSPEENERLKRMKQILIDKDPKVERELVVRRAISVLNQIDSAESIQLRQELSNADPKGPVGRYARAMLKN